MRGINLLTVGWIAVAAGTGASDLLLILMAAVLALIGAGLGWMAALGRRLGRQMEVIGRHFEGDALDRHYRLQESAQVGIYTSNLEGKILDCNQAFARLLGYASPREVIGLEAQGRYSSPNDREEFIARLSVQGRLINFETRLRRKDGSPVWGLENASLRPAEDNVATRIDGAVIDITERKQAEKILAQRASCLNALTESSPLAIVAVDRQGRVEMCNRSFERLFGYCRAEILGADLDELITPPEFLPEVAEYNRRVGDGEILHVVTKRRRKDGVLVDVDFHAVPSMAGATQVGAYAFSQDISERQRAEAELTRAKEAAEASSRAKSTFLANMSHEIRTPMNGIIGMTELALDTDLTPEQREYLRMVKGSADSLLTIINDILDFSKIEAGKLELDRTEFNLSDCLEETIKTFAPEAHRKGLELVCDIAPDLPEALVGDPTRLRQIIVNLVGNAVKFTDRGEVALQVESDARSVDAISLHFTVRDTGIGISPEKHRLIFEAFAQADSSTARRHGGTGLGLSISARLVELMEGHTWVESEPGRGSKFHFTALFNVATQAASRPVTSENVSLDDVRILVVDDNENARRILADLLARWGMKPESVGDAEMALAALHAARSSGEPFSLVLTDSRMPGVDGFALVEKLKEKPQLASAVIMMVASAGLRGDAARCRELGVSAYLTKPVSQSELRQAIQKVLGGRSLGAAPASLVTRHSLREAARPVRTLVAEDDRVSQALVTRLLERQGHEAITVDNGRDALAALEKQEFDLALIDVEMPEMGGLEAMALIRAKERETGAHLPIIAMTAHAMKGDQERCFAAGADAYVSKPVSPWRLSDKIESLTSWASRARQAPAAANPLRGALDLGRALERVEGDTDLLRNMAALFLRDYPEQLAKIREAVSHRDARSLMYLAHTVKGAVGNFAANAAVEAARKLEMVGCDADFTHAEEACRKLEETLEDVRTALEALEGQPLKRERRPLTQ